MASSKCNSKFTVHARKALEETYDVPALMQRYIDEQCLHQTRDLAIERIVGQDLIGGALAELASYVGEDGHVNIERYLRDLSANELAPEIFVPAIQEPKRARPVADRAVIAGQWLEKCKEWSLQDMSYPDAEQLVAQQLVLHMLGSALFSQAEGEDKKLRTDLCLRLLAALRQHLQSGSDVQAARIESYLDEVEQSLQDEGLPVWDYLVADRVHSEFMGPVSGPLIERTVNRRRVILALAHAQQELRSPSSEWPIIWDELHNYNLIKIRLTQGRPQQSTLRSFRVYGQPEDFAQVLWGALHGASLSAMSDRQPRLQAMGLDADCVDYFPIAPWMDLRPYGRASAGVSTPSQDSYDEALRHAGKCARTPKQLHTQIAEAVQSIGEQWHETREVLSAALVEAEEQWQSDEPAGSPSALILGPFYTEREFLQKHLPCERPTSPQRLIPLQVQLPKPFDHLPLYVNVCSLNIAPLNLYRLARPNAADAPTYSLTTAVTVSRYQDLILAEGQFLLDSKRGLFTDPLPLQIMQMAAQQAPCEHDHLAARAYAPRGFKANARTASCADIDCTDCGRTVVEGVWLDELPADLRAALDEHPQSPLARERHAPDEEIRRQRAIHEMMCDPHKLLHAHELGQHRRSPEQIQELVCAHAQQLRLAQQRPTPKPDIPEIDIIDSFTL